MALWGVVSIRVGRVMISPWCSFSIFVVVSSLISGAAVTMTFTAARMPFQLALFRRASGSRVAFASTQVGATDS